jgi:hypothetical protein
MKLPVHLFLSSSPYFLTPGSYVPRSQTQNELRGFSPQARTIPIERLPLVGEVSAHLADRGCRVVSATNPHGR